MMNKNKPWLPAEAKLIREQYGLVPARELAEQLGRSVHAVRRYACTIGASIRPENRAALMKEGMALGNFASTYPAEVRLQALRMHDEGMSRQAIQAELGVSDRALAYWIKYAERASTFPTPVRVKKKSGSGVITPKPYRTNYVWGAGW